MRACLHVNEDGNELHEINIGSWQPSVSSPLPTISERLGKLNIRIKAVGI